MGRRIGYARVSTEDQSLSLQLDALKAAKCDMIFEEKISGKSKLRPALDLALAELQPTDKIIVWKLDRLGRNFHHLVDVAKQINERGAHFLSLTENIDTATVMGEVAYRMICIFADLEHKNIVERTTAGLLATRARGQKLGRRRKLSLEQAREADALMRNGQSAKVVAYRYGVNPATIFRARQTLRTA